MFNEIIQQVFTSNSILTILWWLWFIVTWIWSFYLKKKEIRLQTELDILKSKEILNDEKVRKSYEDFIDLLFKVMHKKASQKEMETWMINFMKKSLLFASSSTIKSFGNYRKISKNVNNNILKVLADLILSMRKDLWVSNSKISYDDVNEIFKK